jgi:hypothetical protein
MKALALVALMFVALARSGGADAPAVPPPLEQPPQGVGLRIFADNTTAFLKTNLVIFSSSGTNKVIAIYPPAKTNDAPAILRCRQLTAKKLSSGKMDFVDADGDVELDQGEDRARGQHAIYHGTNDQVELTGAWRGWVNLGDTNVFLDSTQPILYAGKVWNRGDKIIYDHTEGKLFIRSNVVTDIPDGVLRKAQTNNPAAPKTSAPFP